MSCNISKIGQIKKKSKRQARSSRCQAEEHLAAGDFPRGDHRELSELLVVWLGRGVPNFRFRWPGVCYRARFMAQSILYLKMKLRKNHLTFLSDDESEQIARMAEFVGLFFGVWFPRSSVPAAAPRHDLEAISQMRRNRDEGKKRDGVADTCLDFLWTGTSGTWTPRWSSSPWVMRVYPMRNVRPLDLL